MTAGKSSLCIPTNAPAGVVVSPLLASVGRIVQLYGHAVSGPLFGLVRKCFGNKQTGQQFAFVCQRSKDEANRDTVVRAVHCPHRIPCLNDAGLDHSKVRTRNRPGGKGLDPTMFSEPSGEDPARNSRNGDLQHDPSTDLPTLTDQRVSDVDACGCQILPERSTGQWPSKLGGPDVQVFARIGVDGLIVSAVMPQIAHSITDEPTATDAFRARRTHLNWTRRRLFVNARHPKVRVPSCGRRSDVHGQHRRHDRTIARHDPRQNPFSTSPKFDTSASPVKLALYSRRAAAKDTNVSPEGTGSHRIVIVGDVGPCPDLDGFASEATTTNTMPQTPKPAAHLPNEWAETGPCDGAGSCLAFCKHV